MKVRLYGLIAALGLCCMATGCGGGSGPSASSAVEGVVILNGQEFTEEANINFVSPSTGNAAIAFIGPDGRFYVTGGMVPGEYKVIITPPTPTPENPAPKESNVPEKYRSPETSDLTSRIIGGRNDLKLEMKS